MKLGLTEDGRRDRPVGSVRQAGEGRERSQSRLMWIMRKLNARSGRERKGGTYAPPVRALCRAATGIAGGVAGPRDKCPVPPEAAIRAAAAAVRARAAGWRAGFSH